MTGARRKNEGYEASDAPARPLFLSVLALALVIGLALALSAWISRRETAALALTHKTNPLAVLRKPGDGPLLEAVPAADLARQRAVEEHLLTSTEWIDPVNKIVRIPIEQALELSLREGFPTRTSAPPPTPNSPAPKPDSKPDSKPATKPDAKPAPKGGKK